MNQVFDAVPLLEGYTDQRWRNDRRQKPSSNRNAGSHYDGAERRENSRRKSDRKRGAVGHRPTAAPKP